MTDEMREMYMKAIDKGGRKMRRDPKYAHEVFIHLGIMTPKGNLTRRWQRHKKLFGIEFGHVKRIRRYLGLS